MWQTAVHQLMPPNQAAGATWQTAGHLPMLHLNQNLKRFVNSLDCKRMRQKNATPFKQSVAQFLEENIVKIKN
jgi:hypothetical protein